MPGLALAHASFRRAMRSLAIRSDASCVVSAPLTGGIVDAPYGSGLSFRDPDGIALEFFAPPG